LQDKDVNLVAGERLADGRLRFVCELQVKQAENGQPNFTGPFAHGTAQERFLYLTLKRLQNGEWKIVKRIKVHLKSITADQVASAQAAPGAALVAVVDGRGAASVPLLGAGWTVQNG
jgi:hypothetical protein